MIILIRILAGLAALMFLAMGIGWLARPGAIARELGMPLLHGIGASSQIGDLGSFFFCNGLLMALGQLRGKSHVLYVPALLIGGAALFRMAAVVLGYAPFAPQLVAVEVVITVVLLVAAQRLP